MREPDSLPRACGVLEGREDISADAAVGYLASPAEQRRRAVNDAASQVLPTHARRVGA